MNKMQHRRDQGTNLVYSNGNKCRLKIVDIVFDRKYNIIPINPVVITGL
jgi:hypothetical protein